MAAFLRCTLDCMIQMVFCLHVHADAASLLAHCGLHDHRAEPAHEGNIGIAVARYALLRHVQADRRKPTQRQHLVLTPRHRHAAGQFRERFAAQHFMSRVTQFEDARLGIEHLDADAAPACFIHQNARIWIQAVEVRRIRKQRLVDRILVFHDKARHLLEAELLI